MHTTTIPLTRHWKLISTEQCLIQFNDLTRVALTSGFTPKEKTGFEFKPGSVFVHNGGATLWARIKTPVTGVKSVRVTKEGRVSNLELMLS